MPNDPLEKLVWWLGRASGRNGIFLIVNLGDKRQPQKVAQCIERKLAGKGIPSRLCRLEKEAKPPFQPFEQEFRQAQESDQWAVLVVWCLKHLEQEQLRDTLRWLNRKREWLTLGKTKGGNSIPVVWLVGRTMYPYLREWAGDLLDCVLPPLPLDDSP